MEQTIDRAAMTRLIANAHDIPPALRAAAGIFLAQMTDRQIADLGRKASFALEALRSNDKPLFETRMKALGLPAQFTAFLTQKAFEKNADHPRQ
jgi:hypothetical protein